MASLLDTFLDNEMIPGTDPACVYTYDGCFQFIQRWLVVNGLEPPINFLPFQYKTKRELHVIVRRGGGFINLVDKVATKIGLSKTQDLGSLSEGDIGIIRTTYQSEESALKGRLPYPVYVLAIHVGGKWALKGEQGLHFVPSKPVAAWRLSS